MGKIRFNINSSDVLGVYGIVDIVFNGVTLASSKQLSETVESLEYNVDILTSSDNTLKIHLLNDQAHDSNNDGDYSDTGDQSLVARVSNLSYSVDGATFTTLLPQTEVNHTIPSGVNAGTSILMRPAISQFISYGDYTLKFDNDGLLNTPHFQECYNVKLIDGVYYDGAGNVLPN